MTESASSDRPTKSTPENVVIRASAGTGKTFQLSNRYIAALNIGVPPEQILATTFTRKAAGEILERILIRLAEAAQSDTTCKELAGFLGDAGFTRRRSARLLASLTRQLHRVQVCTLDSFFSQIASSFDLELGLPPGWKIVDQLTASQLQSRAVDRVLSDGDVHDVRRLMHLLTMSDADRSVSRLIETTVSNLYSIFRQTIDDAWRRFPAEPFLPADELKEAIGALHRAPVPSHSTLENTHAAACRFAAEHDWEEFVSNGLAKRIAEGKTQYHRKDLDEALIAAYVRLNTHARSVIVETLKSQTDATRELLSRFHEAHTDLRITERAMRFEDVTHALAQTAVTRQGQRLAYRLDARLSHLLLDEFQDTSLQQWQVIRPLAERLVSRTPDDSPTDHPTSFFCVGDRKQAIYGWRGGESEIFDGLVRQLPAVKEESLNVSYRSAQPIIDTVNLIFQGIGNHGRLSDLADAVHDWKERFPTHKTAKSQLPGYACLITGPERMENESGEAARIRFAAGRIAALTKQTPGRSIGVLTRRNVMVAQLIYQLRRLGVSASEEGGNPLLDSAAVQLVLSLMQMADHPGNTAARFHVARSPLGETLGFTDATDHSAAFHLSRQVRTDLVRRGYGETVERLSRLLAAQCNQRELQRLQQLVELAHAYHNRITVRTTDFIKYVQHEGVDDPAKADVRVMTVFQAKGLEFDTVVLPDLDPLLIAQPDAFVVGRPDPMEPIDRVCVYRNSDIQKCLPDDMRAMFQAARDQRVTESLCVLYVAVTRAVHSLHMIIDPSAASEKGLRKNFAGLLRAALTDGDPVSPETVLFETGDPLWHRQLEISDSQPASAEEQPARIELAPLTGRRQRGLGRAAPSSREGSSRVRLANVLRFGNARALDRGTLIHAWFEQIDWLDNGDWPDETILRKVAKELEAATQLDLDRILSEFQSMLRTPTTAWALMQKSYREPSGLPLPQSVRDELVSAALRLEVHKERRFAVREKNTVVSGSIDRLVLMYHGTRLIAADIIDFKTDAIAADDPHAIAAKVDFYRGQLETYRPAVATLYRLPPERISARLLMVGAGIVENV